LRSDRVALAPARDGEAVLAAEPSNPDPIAERYQGGTLPAAEYTAKTPLA
jgi:hypothetical protein